ncbi:MAG: alpha/beta hydrolase [Chitinophagaceae bacterium]|nr:alpha/beta hydrolase [Chitinophagaceae bacterium]
MKIKKIITVLAIVLLLCAGWMAYIFFYPRKYNVVHLKERAGTRYWTLATGSRIAYTFVPAKGERKPFPIIYLHGGPGAGITDLEIKTLANLSDYGYDVYLYDQVGCGHSNRLTDINEYSAERHREDLAEIIDQVGAQKVILLGQSWGSILGSLYISTNAERVAKFVITAPAAIQPENHVYAAIAVPDSLQMHQPSYNPRYAHSVTSNLRAKAIEFWMRQFGKKLTSDREADQFATFYATYLNKTMVCDTSKAVIAEGTEGYYSHYMTRLSLGKIPDPRPKLMECSIPVLIMKSQCDNQKWGFTTEYFDVFRNHEFALIKNAGHNIFIEQPGEYISVIKTFLEK